MNRLSVGIAGFGVVGRRRKLCIDAHPDLQLVAVCDRTFSETDIGPNGLRICRTPDDLLSEKLDILFVCLTNDVAAKVTIAGLEAGLHVFCEKPPGRNMTDIRLVREAERRHPDLKLMYGFNHRFHDSVQDALRIVRSRRMGKIINMRGVYGKSKLITFNQTDWRTKRAIAGGGVLLDQGIHMLDLMRLFAGEFTKVFSFVSNGHWRYDVEDNAYALMRTSDGVVAQITSSATQWRHRFELDINLERGSVILSGFLSGSKSYGAETLTLVEAEPDSDDGDPREQITRYNKDRSWEREVDTFVASVMRGKPVESGSSEDALKTMELVYRIYYADKGWREAYDILDPSEEVHDPVELS